MAPGTGLCSSCIYSHRQWAVQDRHCRGLPPFVMSTGGQMTQAILSGPWQPLRILTDLAKKKKFSTVLLVKGKKRRTYPITHCKDL